MNTLNKKKIRKLLKTLVVSMAAVLFVLPLIWMILASLKETSEVFSSPFRWLPEVFKWGNYPSVWTNSDMPMVRLFYNSLFIALFTIIGQLLIASFAAYAFAKINFIGKKFLFILYLSSTMIPTQVTIIPTYMLFHSMGLYNNHWAVILPTWYSATSIFLLRQFYIGLPDSLIEAGKVDGASHLRIFMQILLPLTKPALISLAVLAFITSWNDYLSPLIFLTKNRLFTVAQGIRWYLLDEAQQYELTMAIATSAIIPVIILFILLSLIHI